MHAPTAQLQPRGGNKIAQGARHADLAGTRCGANPRTHVHGNSRELTIHALALPGVQTGTHVEPESGYGADDRHGATDRSRRTVEAREKPVADSVDLRTAKPREFAPHYDVVTLGQVA